MRALLILLFGIVLSSVQGADIEVTVKGVEAVKGQVLIGVYDSKKNFRKTPIEGSPKIDVKKAGPISATIKDLKPGTYAVVVVWDLNKNEKLDTGAFKKPIEPFAFSNNPKIPFGPPAFKDCTFVLTEKGKKITLSLKKS